MLIREIQSQINGRISNMTIVFPITESLIVCGVKKRKFGSGKICGFGGKLEGDETFYDCAVRELEEESGVRATDMLHRGTVKCYFKEKFPFSPGVCIEIFSCGEWVGEFQNTDEMEVCFFDVDTVPFERMLPDNRYFVPLLLDENVRNGWVYEFFFDGNLEIIEKLLTV
jgi:8-oxo-dGTP pyrophosphatase MutT (NUDIX family)